MKVLKVEPMKKPEVVEMKQDLESLQKAVDGYIECVYPFDDEVAIVCNEEGKLNGLTLNRAIMDEDGEEILDIIAGTFLIVGARDDDDKFSSLNDKQIETYSKMFARPETFYKDTKGKIRVDRF